MVNQDLGFIPALFAVWITEAATIHTVLYVSNELVDFEFNVDTPSRCKIYCIISMSSNVQEDFGNKLWNIFRNFTPK